MTINDLSFVTEQHHLCFPTNVIGRLGNTALRRYYRTFIDAPFAVAVVAEVEGRACGFVVGIVGTARHRSWLLRYHSLSLTTAAAVSFAAHPVLAGHLLVRRVVAYVRRATRSRQVRRAPHPEGNAIAVGAVEEVAVLSHIAIAEGDRGLGVGSQLLDIFMTQCRAQTCGKISLATLDGDSGAGDFYEKHGWELLSRRQTIDGRWIRLYDFDLRSEGSRAA